MNKFLLLGLLASTSAFAAGINLQTYHSPFNLNYGELESAIHDSRPFEQKLPEPKLFFSANYNYAEDPLVVINTTTNKRVTTLVDHIHTMDLSLGYFINRAFSIYAQVPLHEIKMEGQNNKFQVGDSRLAGKWVMTETTAPITFALMPELILPTGNNKRYLSDDSVGVGILAIAEKDLGAFRVTGNIGYRYASNGKATIVVPGVNNSAPSIIDFRHRVPLGLGAAIPVGQKWLINAEGRGYLSFPTSQQQNPSEFYLGANYQPVRHLAFIAGAAVGTLDQEGSLNYRAQAAVRLYFGAAPAAAPKAEPAKAKAAAPVAKAPAKKARMMNDHIEILGEINFEHNKDRLLESSKLILDDVAEVINRHKDAIAKVVVEGHTSLVGSEEYNDRLSKRRAAAVVRYLTQVRGIPREMLEPKGYGEMRPKYLPGKATAEELEKNRRVEFKVTAKPGAKLNVMDTQ